MRCRWLRRASWPLLLLCSLLVRNPAARAVGAEGEGAAVERVLYLQPMGPGLLPAHVEVVRSWLERTYALKVKVLDHVALPKRAYYKPRKRYRAEKLLEALDETLARPPLPKDAWRIMGLTAVDISTSKPPYDDWGVMGLGELPGKASVLSVFRCRRGARSTEHAFERLGKVAVHELGHTLGLDHCPHRGCLMEDAEGKVVTLDRETGFCEPCRQRLGAALR